MAAQRRQFATDEERLQEQADEAQLWPDPEHQRCSLPWRLAQDKKEVCTRLELEWPCLKARGLRLAHSTLTKATLKTGQGVPERFKTGFRCFILHTDAS